MIKMKQHSSRQETILQFHPLVESIAKKFFSRLPKHIEIDDLISVGFVGLIEAYDRFDASKGIPFQTYATIRIRGAIFDSLRKDDWVPRSVRQRANNLKYNISQLEKDLGRKPTCQEVAQKLKMTPRRFERLQRNAQISTLLSLDIPIGDQDNSLLIDMIASTSEAVDKKIQAAELLAVLLVQVEKLNPREKTIITMFYFNQKSIKELASCFRLTKSRVCQIRKEALQNLRDALQAHFAC